MDPLVAVTGLVLGWLAREVIAPVVYQPVPVTVHNYITLSREEAPPPLASIREVPRRENVDGWTGPRCHHHTHPPGTNFAIPGTPRRW